MIVSRYLGRIMKQYTGLLSNLKWPSYGNGIAGRFETGIAISMLLVISFFYFYIFETGIFFLQESNSLFIWSADYFRVFGSKPGGVLNYAGNFLTQFYYNPFYGSLILTSLLFLFFLVLNRIASVLNKGAHFPVLMILIPSSLFLLLQTRFDFQVYNMLGFLIILAWFYLTISRDSKVNRIAQIVFFPVLFYLTGSFSIIYLALYIIYYVFLRRGKQSVIQSLILLVAAIITFIIFKSVLFLQPVDRLFAYPLLKDASVNLTAFLLLFSCYMVLFPLTIRSGGYLLRYKLFERYGSLLSIGLIFPLTIFILIKNHDPDIDNILKIEKFAFDRNWDEIIRQQEREQSSGIIPEFYYNLALAEKGQLCSRMFFSPQSYGTMSLTLKRDDEQSSRAMYFYYAVGLTGEAHHLAYELMVQHGYRPETIKMLIKTELINGNLKVADRYINLLKKTLHYKRWAEKYEKMLHKPELIPADPELGQKLQLMPKYDFFVFTDDFRNIETLLQGNPGNRIAYEYKIARLLLEKDIMALGDEIKNLGGLGYTNIPRHIEEALVSLVNITGEFPDLGGLSVSSDTEQRFFRYLSNVKSFRGNRNLVEKGIHKADRNTFWYYLHFGVIKSDFFSGRHMDENIY